MMNKLSHKVLHREGAALGDSSARERFSSDFCIDDISLLSLLTRALGSGDSNFMGCFVRGYPAENKQVLSRLVLKSNPDSPSNRVLLHVCPECADIGGGAFSASIKKTADTYVWEKFAYETGYKEPHELKDMGPLRFSLQNYESAIYAAAAL